MFIGDSVKVIVSAGGTGGHIYPALAIINKLKERHKDLEVLYIGTTDRMEKDLIPSLGINYVGIEMKGLNRKKPLKNFSVIKSFRKAIKDIEKIMKEFKPDVVLGIGGYITAPVVLAAHKLKIKTFIHEQNSIPGLSNKLLKKKASVIGVSLKESEKYFKRSNVVFTGNPRSEEAYNAEPVDKKKYGFHNDKKLVLFVMGSLGSYTVTNVLIESIPKLGTKDYEVLLITGKRFLENYEGIEIPKNVKMVPLIDDMLNVLKKTDLIVTRAGASTIAEITAVGVPAIMIPSSHVTHNHQEKNAEVLEKNGSAVVIKEKDLTSDLMMNTIDSLINDDKKLKEMSEASKLMGVKDSATKIACIIEDLVSGDNDGKHNRVHRKK